MIASFVIPLITGHGLPGLITVYCSKFSVFSFQFSAFASRLLTPGYRLPAGRARALYLLCPATCFARADGTDGMMFRAASHGRAGCRRISFSWAAFGARVQFRARKKGHRRMDRRPAYPLEEQVGGAENADLPAARRAGRGRRGKRGLQVWQNRQHKETGEP